MIPWDPNMDPSVKEEKILAEPGLQAQRAEEATKMTHLMVSCCLIIKPSWTLVTDDCGKDIQNPQP